MRRGKPSVTAAWVSFWRGAAGYETPAIVSDNASTHLTPAPYRTLLRGAEKHPTIARAVMRLADRLSQGRVRHMGLRTRAIDDLVVDAVSRGIAQVVLLGAGLDARAYRLDGIESATVFEVDHPSTQRGKRARLVALSPKSREVRFVGVDFERDRLVDELSAHGFDAHARSIFVWEGVTMYLSRAAIEATLAAIASLTASGSELALTYVTHAPPPIVPWVVRAAGEPFRTYFSADELGALLGAHGFIVASDRGDPEWSRHYLSREQRWSLERLVHAVKAPPAAGAH